MPHPPHLTKKNAYSLRLNISLFRRIATVAANNGAFAKINGTKPPEASSIWQSGEKVQMVLKFLS